ncbi:MAG: outer membrane receptor for ferrienterochelin and colicins [Polyangiales bacterium]|jgi:outer membrane receptor for ferrienterochelin and colicins
MFRIFTFLLSLSLVMATGAPALAQSGAENAEAARHFERGNDALARARRSRGARQTRHLEQALAAYVDTLAIVRSRNALFNAGLVLEQLERGAEAFAYFQEYIHVSGLSDDERADGQSHLDALRPSLALTTITTEPPGATVYVDRVDLAPRGTTPLELALVPGEHRVFVRLEHYQDLERSFDAVTGESAELNLPLEARDVEVVFELAGGEGVQLEVDGDVTTAMRLSLSPGPHVARLLSASRQPVERRFVVRPGEPLRLRLDAAGAADLSGTIVVVSEAGASVSVNGLEVGEGAEVRHEARPGQHVVRVEAVHRTPYEQMISVSAGQTVRVDVELGRRAGRPLGPLPHIALGLTVAAGVGFGILAASARADNNSFEDRCPSPGATQAECRILADDVDRANVRADIVLGVVGALAVTTVLFYIFNREREDPSRGQVDVMANRQGGALSYTGSF